MGEHLTADHTISDLPDDPILFVRRLLAANWSRSRVLAGQLLSWKSGGSRALHSMSTCGRREVITSGVTSTPSAITTTMLHLCSAPCKALRFAPPARTRGLRALTVPARRRSAGIYVMAVECSFRPERMAH